MIASLFTRAGATVNSYFLLSASLWRYMLLAVDSPPLSVVVPARTISGAAYYVLEHSVMLYCISALFLFLYFLPSHSCD